MRPTQSQSQPQCNDEHAKRDQNGICPPPLKLNKDSHMIIKKSSSSSSSSPPPPSSSTTHRHPVIIYTHSPKIIHTSPKDFMALVQKLTGLSGSNNNEDGHHQTTTAVAATSDQQNNNNNNNNNNGLSDDESNKNVKNDNNNNNNNNNNNISGNDDNESSSVITSDENCGGGGVGGGCGNIVEGQVNSCFVPAPPIFETTPNHYMGNNYPIFNPNSADFLCTNPPFYNYTTDSLFFQPKMRASISSSSPPDYHHHHHGMGDFHEY